MYSYDRRSAALRQAATLHCDMKKDCKNPVTHIDNKGFVYCTQHGEQRRTNGTPCRKLRPAEIKKLEADGTVRYSSVKTADGQEFFELLDAEYNSVKYDAAKGSGWADAGSLGKIEFHESGNDPAVIMTLTKPPQIQGEARGNDEDH